ncbi:MAG: GyrI-like domain-containing protein [Candidatus Kapaibacteriota bacterium]
MNIRFIECNPRIIIGRSLTLPLQSMDVFSLWQQFRTEQMQAGIINVELYSMQAYHEWPPATSITHFACLEKIDKQEYPTGWIEFTIQGGKYATFEYGGTRAEFPTMLKHVILDILPRTKHQFDPTRNQFQIMPSEYSMSDPNAIESVFVPVL